MPKSLPPYKIIETKPELEAFYLQHKDLEWMGFDTEFVGEKRFVTQLCLIQTTSTIGHFIIDPLKLADIDPFLQLIEHPGILKITHAGENDYRLLNNLYGILPSNLFDAQIAAAFTGYKYPTSFQKLVEGELKKILKKGYSVTDWERRPIQVAQLSYALEDVIFLPDLWRTLSQKLEKSGRLEWAQEEFAKLESADYYARDPHQEALQSNMMRSLNEREQVFLLRIYEWRRKLAEKRNHSKEMVLSSKLIPMIVKNIASGKNALLQNRRLPDRLTHEYGDLFLSMFEQAPTQEERRVLKQIPLEREEDEKEEIIQEVLYQMVKYKCFENEISINMMFSRNNLRKFRAEPEEARRLLENSWRGRLLGNSFLDWLTSAKDMDVDMADSKIEIELK